VRSTDDGEREIVTMSWGFMLVQNGRAPLEQARKILDPILEHMMDAVHRYEVL
jgi:hypothetical protein